jgi:hypothetical protein
MAHWVATGCVYCARPVEVDLDRLCRAAVEPCCPRCAKAAGLAGACGLFLFVPLLVLVLVEAFHG